MSHDPRSRARARWTIAATVVGCALLLALRAVGHHEPRCGAGAADTLVLCVSVDVVDSPPAPAPQDANQLDPIAQLTISAGLDEDWVETATTDDPVEVCPDGSTLSAAAENLLNTPSLVGKWTCGSAP